MQNFIKITPFTHHHCPSLRSDRQTKEKQSLIPASFNGTVQHFISLIVVIYIQGKLNTVKN